MEHDSQADIEADDARDDASEKATATYEDLMLLFSGEATIETRRRLAKALFDPEHPLSYLARRSTDDQPFESKWPPDDIPDSIRELLEG